jgi:hypothetical protein
VAEDARVFALATAVVRALMPGNGRSSHCETEDDIRSRLDADGASYDPQELPAALSLLENDGEHAMTSARCRDFRTGFYDPSRTSGRVQPSASRQPRGWSSSSG